MSDTNKTELITLLDSIKDLYSDAELAKIQTVLEQVTSKGRKKAKQIRPIVPIREWLESEYYLGSFANDLYPYWKEQIINIFESPVRINEVILTGATGCLKTDTLYSTTEGFKTLKDLNYKYFNIRSETTSEQAKVTDSHFLGVQPTKIVTLENGTVLEGTLNHRIKVLRNNKIDWVRFDKLIKGDIVIHSRLKEPFGTTSIPEDLAYSIGINIEQVYEEQLNYFYKTILELNDRAFSKVLKGIFNRSNINFKTGSIELQIKNKNLAYIIKRVLAAYGINSYINTELDKISTITIKGYEDLILYNKYIGFKGQYLKQDLQNLLNISPKTKEISGLPLETLKYFVENDVYTVKVKSIENSEAEVGDIEVPTTHQYNIGGIISHNTGKTYAATIIMMRRIYELSCYENISMLFPNLSSISRIAMAYLSVTATQAKQTGFHTIREFFDSIPYFRDEFKRNENIDSMLVWDQENFFVTYGSRLNHFIGLDLLGSVLDEANYFKGREVTETIGRDNPVYLLYDQIVSRAHSRFVTKEGNDSLSIIASSSTIASSFTEERIKQSLDDPTVYIASPAIWDVRPDQYSGERFFVFAGTEVVDPSLIDNLEDLNRILDAHKYTTITKNITIEEALELVPTDIRYRVRSVPIEHRSAFKTNIVFMLQDLAGFSVASSNRFFTSKQAYESCLENNLSHPFTKDEIILSTTKDSFKQGYLHIMDYFKNDLLFKNPEVPRFIHLDLALTGDSVGIAMAHISNWKKLNESHQEKIETKPETHFVGGTSDAFEASLKVFSKASAIQIHDNELKLPVITVDFMLRINPPPKPDAVSFGKIRDFIIWLKYVKRVNIQKVTFDQFQSAQMRQELEEAGIPTGYLSVDRTSTPYDTLRNLVQDSRVKLYSYEPFRQEFFSLIETRNMAGKAKIDHPKNGSKDVSDAVAGAIFTAVDIEDKTDVTAQSLNEVFLTTNKRNTTEQNIQAEVNKLLNILKD